MKEKSKIQAIAKRSDRRIDSGPANGSPQTAPNEPRDPGKTPRLKEFARLLLAREAESGGPAETNDSPGFRVCERLRQPLGRLLGNGGFRALLSRAQALAGAEVNWLRDLRIKADGSLEGLEEAEAKLDSRAVAEGEIVLVSQLLGLLITFIGPALTLRMLHDIWPKMEDLVFEKEKCYEEK